MYTAASLFVIRLSNKTGSLALMLHRFSLFGKSPIDFYLFTRLFHEGTASGVGRPPIGKNEFMIMY